MVVMGMLSFAFASAGNIWLLVPFLIFFSTGLGGINPTRVVVVREYFGRSSFGTIHGIIMGLMTVGNIAGTPLAGWVFDTWKTYQPVWFVFAVLAFIGAIFIFTMPKAVSTNKK